MPIYEDAPPDCREVCDRMIEKYHGELQDAGVTIDLLFATPRPDGDGEIAPEAVALKLHGYQVAALVKINSYKLRVQGHADAEIVVDGNRWPTWSIEQQEALIDHELEHLELKVDKEGNLVRDDLDRPKLRTRLHDHEFGWFDSIARRHGKDSFEVQQWTEFSGRVKQTWFSGMRAEDERDGGISSVTISTGNKSVTLKGGANKFKETCDKVVAEVRKTGRRAASKG